ncbi:MAG: carboxypeptidase regulatory-like domain-containing protein [Acidobacteria bacterium]|nr:carboxypeptidase regulatory-like domain-containing protein [Acidobacteriota bacterium]
MKFLGLICVFAALTFGVNAATFTVNTTSDTQDATAGNGICADSLGNCSLRAAITEANALAGADTITLPAGTYTITLTGSGENVNASGDFDLTSEITINGAGSGSTIVQGAASRGTATERVFHLRATGVPTSISGLTVRWGRYTTAAGTFGAGIRVDVGAVNATLTDVVVTENDDGTSGGGIAVSGATGATLTLNNCTVSNNTAGGTAATSSTGAGIMGNSAATININNSTVTGNTVSNTSTTVAASGGGVTSIGTLNITNSTVSNNTATTSGFNAFTGGVHVTGGTATITGSTISGNASTVTAGTGSAFTGGIYNQQATVTISNSVITGNSVSNSVTASQAYHGGVRTLASTTAAATTTITNSTISSNTANGEGGGIVNIAGSTFNATVNLTGSTVSGNSATGATAVGAGVENFSSSTGTATVNATNSTISGNTTPGSGGGVYNSGTAATINLNYATVAGNTGTTAGGGLFQNATGTTNLKNSIVADNVSGASPDISGTITSQDYNHVEDTTGGTFFASPAARKRGLASPGMFALANDVTGTDPQLGALANNGGPTLTQMPAQTSPVLNTIPNGTSDCGTVVTTSQNGLARPQQTGCEKGAAERSVPTAAGSMIRGKLRTPTGSGLSNAVVVLTNTATGEVRSARSGSFGTFVFEDCPSGDVYVLTVQSRKYRFDQNIFTLNGDLTDLVMNAQE